MRILNYSLCFFAAVIFACSGSQKEKSNVEQVDTDVEAKIDSILKLLTLEEKITMIHASSSFTSGGVARLGIPELVMSDGPNGVRKEHGRDWEHDKDANDSATYLPPGIALAATWNKELGYEYGKVLGEEAKFRGKDILLGPGINIFRTPLNGRNYEYLGEDPYLTSQMAVGYIRGLQDQGVSACVKHYLANNQETRRDSINVEMSERALREIYLPGFAAAVREADVNTIMGAYNKFRGQWCTHNEYLINKILKEELSFQGVVISDWGAVHNTKQAALYGCDIEMGTDLSMLPKPNYNKFYMGDSLLAMVKNGTISEKVIDDKVRRILRIMFKTNLLNKQAQKGGSFNTPEHQAAARKVAEESITLLKNDNNFLPLNKNTAIKIAVIGANADRKHAGAGGSGQVNAKYEITPLQGLKNTIGNNSIITFADGYTVEKGKTATDQQITKAVKIAKEADVVIYVGGWIHGYSDNWNDNAYDAESVDKSDMKLPFGQEKLIAEVLNANPKTLIVLMGGGPVEMASFINKAPAVIQAWYPGMEGGNALADIIFGVVNPSGKLPVSFPKTLKDSPAHKIGEYPGNGKTVVYKDDIWVGYRYFDTKKVEPQFPFGHGLSYTTFEFSDLQIQKGKDGVIVKLNVVNTGKTAGAEVVQIYVKDDEASVERPDKELKGFDKVFLNPGEKKEVSIHLRPEAFRFFDEEKMQWVQEPGKFTILAGSSSRNIKLKGTLEL